MWKGRKYIFYEVLHFKDAVWVAQCEGMHQTFYALSLGLKTTVKKISINIRQTCGLALYAKQQWKSAETPSPAGTVGKEAVCN